MIYQYCYYYITYNVLGKYGTEAFEDVGHSTDARELMGKYFIGELAEVSKYFKTSCTRFRKQCIRTEYFFCIFV